nr:hypothetical protein [Candidatus Cloacimonadota bacterium]
MKTYKLIIGGERFEARILEHSSNHAKININGDDYLVQIEEDHQSDVPKLEGRDRAVPMAPSFTSGIDLASGEVRAPLPGVIIKIPVREGDKVKSGQTIVVIEAMKMESEISSPIDATISKIMVKERTLVQEGDVLMTLESDEVTASAQKNAKSKASPKYQRIETVQNSPAQSAASDDNVVKAPIPGTIIDVPVNVNQYVHDGDVAVILEAMKMESEIHFTKNGKVKKIHVKRGDSVQEGDPLIELES